VGPDPAHNKGLHHPVDPVLEALSSSKDQLKGLHRDPSRVAQEDRVLSSPHKDLWVGRHLHREAMAAHLQEVRAHLNGQNKRAAHHGGSLLGILYALNKRENSLHQTNWRILSHNQQKENPVLCGIIPYYMADQRLRDRRAYVLTVAILKPTIVRCFASMTTAKRAVDDVV